MPTYYLNLSPETVVSIVRTGKLPNELPECVKIDYLICQKNIANCFSGNTTTLHQQFILELDFPTKKEKMNDFLVLESLNIDSIQRIIVYSSRGNNLLNHLFESNCPKPIIINAAVFPSSSNPAPKRPLANLFNTSQIDTDRDTKKTRIQPQASSSNTNAIKKREQGKEEDDDIVIERISTYDEHLQLLQKAFREAKKSILITSYSITHETLEKAGLYKLIRAAASRGVRIYLYYNDQKIIESRIVNFLKQNKVTFADTYTHSKILAVDNYFVAAGSFNWLSTINKQYAPSEEASLCIRGQDICSDLIEEFWKHIKYYRNEQFGNIRSLNRFERNADNMSTLVCGLDDKTEISYFPTLDEQCGFLQECFERAQRRIIICSPFISSNRSYELDLDYELLQDTIARGVNIYFVCSSESTSLKDFSDFLNKLNSSQIHLIPLKNIHLKTIIVDEDTIAEGSFNWLSASRDRDSDYHNHEQTISIQGNSAREPIAHFFKSRIGKAILDNMCTGKNERTNSSAFKQQTESNTRKKLIEARKDRQALLLQACRAGDLKEAIETIELGIKAPCLIIEAAEVGQLEIIKLLVNKGFSVKEKDSFGWNAIHWAAKEDNLSIIAYFYDHFRTEFNDRTGQGIYNGLETVLHIAIRYKANATINFLIDKKFAINESDQNRWTALRWAMEKVEKNDYTLCQQLLRAGADINCLDNDRNSLLHIAAKAEKVDQVRYLLQNDANPNVKNEDGDTPLHLVTYPASDGTFFSGSKNAQEIVKLLIAFNASIDTVNHRNKTPLTDAGTNVKRIIKEWQSKQKTYQRLPNNKLF